MSNEVLKESLKVVAFILAAGCSKRFGGKIKQLLPYKGKAILQRVVDEACKSQADEVYIVLGCRWRTISRNIKARRAKIIINRNYERGLSSSIKTAVERAKMINADACIILLGDQPFVNYRFINKIIDVFVDKADAAGVLSSYGEVIGTPAIIGKLLFDQVGKIAGDAGAKALLGKREDVIRIDAPAEMLTDVDTEEDYRNLMKIQ
jgi:molybdenum cofactor cytidylyltransferase